MKIAITGASGFVGSYLSEEFTRKGWQVVQLGREDFRAGPGKLPEKLKGAEAVINLAGAPVIGRWTEGYMKTMYQSRVDLTGKLVEALATLEKRPRLLISTSAVGYYSDKREHDEYEYERADDFLGQMAHDWETAALRAKGLGMRTVIFRLGIVLGRGGGAMARMLPPFRLGLGGTIGDGSQALSWVHMNDIGNAMLSAIEDTGYEGAYNLCAPAPSTNRGLTLALARALGRPALLRVPGFILRLQFGQGANVLTSGQRVLPKRLLEMGFCFSFEDIESAIKDCVT